jgi:uncharacterized protein YqgQ
VIKHNVAKFVGHYGTMVAFGKSRTSIEGILQKALELYKSKHSKNRSFVFLFCWFLLKDLHKWVDF